MTKRIDIKVGEDEKFPATCKIEKNFISLNYLAHYVQPQSAEGCIISQNEDTTVHIIELDSPSNSSHSSFQVDIIIDIRPFNPDAKLSKSLVLILKCEKAVNWVIKTHNIAGKLHVLTPNSVSFDKDTEKSLLTSKLVITSIPSTQESLIKWASDENYPANFYTHASVANKFQIKLLDDIVEMNDDDKSDIPPGWLDFLSLSDSEGMGAFNPTSEDFRHRRIEDVDMGDTLKEPEEAQGNINVALSVKCDDTKMMAAIQKENLQFNCTMPQDTGSPFDLIFAHPDAAINNVTFNMELYKTDLFLTPSQNYFSVAENGQVYV
ncbi:unnamed protein product, partial [Staurois parvus]